MTRKTTSLLTAALLLLNLSAAVSCGGEAVVPPVSSDTAVSDSQTTVPPDIFENVDFGGKTFRILFADLAGQDFASLIQATELTGDVLNDALYTRAQDVRDALNVNIAYTGVENAAEQLMQTVMAGEDAYQMAIVHRVSHVADMAIGQYLTDYSELPYVRLDADWWNQSAMQTMSYNGHRYYGYNDLYPVTTFCVFFNTDIAENAGIGNLYQTVDSGKWTVDTMNEMIYKAAKDLNGDGKFTKEDDRFGLSIRNTTIMTGLYFGSDIHLSENKGNRVELSLYSEKLLNLLEKTVPVLSDPDAVYLKVGSSLKADDLTIRSGNVLFYFDSLENANKHRASEVNFGILPYPKYEEAQENYISFANPCLQCVPQTAADKEMVGAVIEYLACHSEEVTESFYERVLKGKVAENEDAARMIDLMLDHYVVDFAANYCGFGEACGKLYNIYSSMVADNTLNVSSFYTKWKDSAQAEIDSVFKE